MKKIKSQLATRFEMKDMGDLHYCLGVTITQDKGEIGMCQQLYIQNLLKKYGLLDAKVVATPFDCGTVLSKEMGDSQQADQALYQSMVGSLMYIANATTPDISYSVGVVSRYCSSPSQVHLNAVKRIFRYLKKTSNLSLTFKKQSTLSLTGFSDADWARDPDDRHSTSGIIFIMTGGAITWSSKKQTLSTTEAEYISLSTATQDAIWLISLLSEIDSSFKKPIRLMEDNQSAIAIAKNPVYHSRTKHIDVRYHYTRETIKEGTIDLSYCPSNEMVADILTKPLSKEILEKLRSALGLSICQSSGSIKTDNYLYD